MIEPVPRSTICAPDDAAAVPEAVDVDVQHRAPLVLRDVERGAVEADAGVVDEHVDGPELGRDRLEHRVDARGIGDVGGDRERAELARHRLGAGGVARGDRHARAGLAERPGERLPDTAIAAGDDGDLAVEPERVQDRHGPGLSQVPTRRGPATRSCGFSHTYGPAGPAWKWTPSVGVHVVAQGVGDGSEDSSHDGSFLGSGEVGGGETRGTDALSLPPVRRVVHPSPEIVTSL